MGVRCRRDQPVGADNESFGMQPGRCINRCLRGGSGFRAFPELPGNAVGTRRETRTGVTRFRTRADAVDSGLPSYPSVICASTCNGRLVGRAYPQRYESSRLIYEQYLADVASAGVGVAEFRNWLSMFRVTAGFFEHGVIHDNTT